MLRNSKMLLNDEIYIILVEGTVWKHHMNNFIPFDTELVTKLITLSQTK